MASEKPHFLNITSGSITASTSTTDTIEVGSNEIYEIHEIRVRSATGTYDLEISDNAGYNYSNEKIRMPAVGSAPNEYNIYKLPVPLIMPRASKFTFTFTDTSAATNTVRMLLIAKRILD